MALSADEQKLLDFALGALPPWFGDTETRDLAVEGGMAKMMGAAKAQITYWFDRTLITGADGPAAGLPDWLQQHAIDRDTRRANGEGDPELQSRLRTFPDALTRATLLSVTDAILDAAGIVAAPFMLELRRDRGYLVTNQPQIDASAGGEFINHGGNVWGFLPTDGWRDNAPPFRGAGIEPPIAYAITFSGAAAAGNDGSFAIIGLDEDEALYVNATGVAGVDAGVAFRVDRYDRNGNCLTAGTGKVDAYCDRGHRCGATWPSIVIILPFGTTEAVALSVAEAVRQRKAAGVRVIVERRLIP